MLNKKRLLLLLPVALLTACGGGSSENEKLLTPSFSFAVSDAPVDALSAVVICFNQVQLKRSESAGGDVIFTVGGASGIIDANEVCLNNSDNLIPDTVGINLLDFTGSNSIALVDSVPIDAGDYSQIRLVMSEGSFAIDDATGERFDVSVPSNELKLDGFTATLGGVINFTLEFDLRKAMTNPVGKPGEYFLKPRGVRLVDNSEAGHIAGTISQDWLNDNSCIVPSVYLYQGFDLLSTELADNGGDEPNQPLASTGVIFDDVDTYNFEIGFVNAGEYTVAVSCDMDDLLPDGEDGLIFIEPKNVLVVAGNTPSEVVYDVDP